MTKPTTVVVVQAFREFVADSSEGQDGEELAKFGVGFERCVVARDRGSDHLVIQALEALSQVGG